MEPPVESHQSAKCILFDQSITNFQPQARLDFTPTGDRMTTITFAPVAASDGSAGRAHAYRTVPKSKQGRNSSVGSNASVGTPSTVRFGVEDMEADECLEYL